MTHRPPQILSIAMMGCLIGSSIIGLQAKRPLNHDDFDAWQRVRVNAITPSGAWSAFSVEPQEGDAMLTLRNNRKGTEIQIPRGYKPAFTADDKWALALIKPLFADTRKAKIDKKKDFDLPQDTLAIIDLLSGRIEKIPNVIGFKTGEKGGSFVAYQTCDTLYIKPSDLKNKEAGKPLVVRSLTSPLTKVVKWVDDYGFSKDGSRLAITISPAESDSTASNAVALLNLPDTTLITLDKEKKFYSLPAFTEDASAIAWTASEDSLESGTKHALLYYSNLTYGATNPDVARYDVALTTRTPINLQPARSNDPKEQAAMDEERRKAIEESQGNLLTINEYSTPEFSRSGRYLMVGVAPVVAPDDTTLVDFEKAGLDIWRWDAPITPPQEKANLNKIREKTIPAVFDTRNGMTWRLPTKEMLADVEWSEGMDSDWLLIHDPSEKIIERQWDYLAPEHLTLYNAATGESIDAGMANQDNFDFAPSGKFIVKFQDRHYHAFSPATRQWVNISENVPYPVWDTEDDHPMPSQAVGIAGWTADDRVLVYDRHDIWSLDLNGKSAPICLTNGVGRKENRRYTLHQLDPEKLIISKGDLMVLDVIDLNDMRRGLATMKYTASAANPSLKLLDTYKLTQLTKAKDADVFMWQRANFSTMPDLWSVNSTDFGKARQLTHSNPQLADISWGTAQLVEWEAYDGKTAKGVLYLPEDFDPEGSYPMLSVFYETNAEELYMHYTMEPSWSWVNYPFYVSRGYVVFVPDIHYTAGVPGESAYNYVCSGVEEMCRRYPAIDKNRLGIDGQSWGGYQTAYLVTRTNMFACAGSGAPVANMTSAFGGIRWGSGDSRQAQYEMGQSRIGRNLWEAPELYIANSPVFYANRVETPLLIMHNDADGAVPWYQGIEMFMALRRLQKPVWLLQYNGEAHNIKERRNRKDITKRLQQFFDHYLMGTPMPRWMKDGINPLRKGQDYGF